MKGKKGLIALICLIVVIVAGVVIWQVTKPAAVPETTPNAVENEESDATVTDIEPAADSEPVTYRALYASEVSTLNYLIASTQWDQTVGANIVDSLVEYDNTGKIIPGLAESWETSEDGLTWTFHLRHGQKWYDYQGNEVAEVTANDFVAALEYVLNPANNSPIAKNVWGARILNAEEHYNSLIPKDPDEEAEEKEEEEVDDTDYTDFSVVGVKAVDDYTLQYTLSSPLPYFLSTLTYVCFLPAYGPQLEELGTDFGTSNDKIYYSGAYIMDYFEPQVGHHYIKNYNNWDADNIYIEAIERTYNSEASTLAPEMARRGDVDSASLDNDIIDGWKANYPEIVTRGRAVPDYSYFYCFNFDPQYDAIYGPDNWRIAVNNSNFRHSIMSAFDRLYAMSAIDPESPETVLQNTVNPTGFASVDGVDFTALPAFNGIMDNYYDADKAIEYRDAAIAELTELGVTFPITMVVTYRSDDSDWANESILLKQQLEGVLGTDYIIVELYAGPTDNFLASTRRAGVYSFMRCNWGADYADPETWTDPFAVTKDSDTGAIVGNSYNKMDLMLTDDYEQFTETRAFLTDYYAAVDTAKAEVVDMPGRYNLFADAEAMLINNAIVVPYFISPAGYQVTKLNIFEAEYAPFGISTLRYKHQHLSDDFITAEEYEASFTEWQAAMEN